MIKKEEILPIIKNIVTSKIIIGIISFVVGTIVSPYVSETIKHIVEKRFASKELSYEVYSITHYRSSELVSVAKSHGIDSFDLKLDDPILADYSLAKIVLKNESGPIATSLRLNAHIGKESAKIIDVKFKVIRPAHKTVSIFHSLPNLTWALPKTVSPAMNWDVGKDTTTTAGFQIYRSLLRDRGYGRIEHKLIRESHYTIVGSSSESLSRSFYRMKAVSTSGWESGMTDPVAFPEGLALLPYFKNSVYISSNKDKGKLLESNEFVSLSDAMSKSNPRTMYIVNQRRQDILKGENLSNDPRVFYEDDLRFLKGEVDISLLDGIDEDAEIEILVLYKLLSREKSDLSLSLQGATGISLKKVGKIQPKTEHIVNKTENVNNKRESLTPAEVNTYSANGVLYLVWKKPEGVDYGGVRIFRSVKRNWENLDNLGKEIYQGTGLSKIFECKMLESRPIEKSHAPNQTTRDKALNFQPPTPRETASSMPAPPQMPRLWVMDEVGSKGELSFGDDSVSPNIIYTYTLIAFDKDHNYSYPVLLNTSVEGTTEIRHCVITEKSMPSKAKSSP